MPLIKKTQNFDFAIIWVLLFVAIFLMQLIFALPSGTNAGTIGINLKTLIGLGGVNRNLVDQGQYYRLITAGFLHLSFNHLLFNCWALYFAVNILQLLTSRIWILVIFLIGVIGSSGLSIMINDPKIVSVGASGGIMALFAAVIILGFASNLDAESKRTVVSYGMLIALPSILPFFYATAKGIDYSGHVGGFITGSVLSAIIIFFSFISKRLSQAVAIILLFPSLLFLGYGIFKVINFYQIFKLELLKK